MLSHSISVYARSLETLRTIEKAIRFFIWSSDIKMRKMVIISCTNICKLINHAGFGLRSVVCLN